MASITGSGVITEQHNYLIDGNDNKGVQVVLGSGSATDITNTYFDWLGRKVQVWHPEWDGNYYAKQWYYNSNGQVYKFTQPGQSAILYTYDTLGNLFQTCLDVNNNGAIDTNGTDRIAETTVAFFNGGGGTWFLQTQKATYATANNSARTVLNTQYDLVSNFTGTMVAQTQNYDRYGNFSAVTVNHNATSKIVTKDTIVVGSNTDQYEVSYNGLPVEARDSTGIIMRTEFDALDRQVKSIDPRTAGTGSTPNGTVTNYLAGGSLVGTVVDPASITQATYTYTSAGQVATLANALTNVSRFEYDNLGHKLHQWGDTEVPVEYVYDALGRQSIMHTYRGGTNWSNASWSTAASGLTADSTTWAYDTNAGLLKSKTDATGTNAVTFTYTIARQLLTRTSARAGTGSGGIVTTYGYDANTGELLTKTYTNDPGSTYPITYTYNRLGKLATAVDYSGTHTFNYNLSGTLEQSSEDLYGSTRLTYNYDTTSTKGRPTGYGLGTPANNTAQQSVTYSYDSLGRAYGLAGSSNGTGTQSFTYGYAPNADLVATVTNPTLTYSDTRLYNASRNLLSSRTTTTTIGTTLTTIASFDYSKTGTMPGPDALGRMKDVTKTGTLFAIYGNGTQGLATSWGYDNRNELTTESTVLGRTSTPLAPRTDSYSYDPVGNRLTTTHNSFTANYSSTNSLNEYGARDVPRTFDVAGATYYSPVTVSSSGGPTDIVSHTTTGNYYFDAYLLASSNNAAYGIININDGHNPQLQLPAFVPKTQEQFTYDADGNLTSDGLWNYLYDAENRVTFISTCSSAAAALFPNVAYGFYYDYLGRRYAKLVYSWNVTTWALQKSLQFTYNGWNLIQTIDSSTTVNKNYFWGLDLSGTSQGAGGVGGLLMIQDGGTSYLPVYDGGGSVYGLLSSADGSIAAAYEYDAFGKVLRESGPYGASNPWQYSTKYTDVETALVYYGFRFYNPSTGRFVNRDPAEEAGGVNLYGFCANNAVNGWDYLGMVPRWVEDSPGDATHNATGHWIDDEDGDAEGAPALSFFDRLERGLSDSPSLDAYLNRIITPTHADQNTSNYTSQYTYQSSTNTSAPSIGGGPSEGATQTGSNGTDTWTMTWHNIGPAGPAWYNDELIALEGGTPNSTSEYPANMPRDGILAFGPMGSPSEGNSLEGPLHVGGMIAAGGGLIVAPGDLLHNDSFWRQLNGTWRWRDAASESNYLLNRSYRLMGERLEFLKAAGKWVGGVGLGISILDIGFNGLNGRNGADAVFGVAGFFPPVGTAVAATYALATLTWDIYNAVNKPPPGAVLAPKQ